MGDKDKGCPARLLIIKYHLQNVPCRLLIKIPRRLIRQKDVRLANQGASKNQPLPLPPAQNSGHLACKTAKPQPLKNRPAPTRRLAENLASQKEGKYNILQNGQVPLDVDILKTETNMFVAEDSEGGVIEGGYIASIKQNSPLCGGLKTAYYMQERGFSAAGPALNENALARLQCEREVFQDPGLAIAKTFEDILELKHHMPIWSAGASLPHK